MALKPIWHTPLSNNSAGSQAVHTKACMTSTSVRAADSCTTSLKRTHVYNPQEVLHQPQPTLPLRRALGVHAAASFSTYLTYSLMTRSSTN